MPSVNSMYIIPTLMHALQHKANKPKLVGDAICTINDIVCLVGCVGNRYENVGRVVDQS